MSHFYAALTEYELRHLPAHLGALGWWDELEGTLTDLPYLEARAEAGAVFELAADIHDALKALPPGRPAPRALRLLEEALRRDLHFIARHPTALFQCLWNACWWYDCAEAARHYQSVGGSWPAEGAPWERPGPKLSGLLESWLEGKAERTPGFLWLRSLRPPPASLGTPLRAVLRGHRGSVLAVAAFPGGDRIVSGSEDGTLRVWEVATERELASLEGHEGPVLAVAVLPGGKFVSGGRDGTVRLWGLSPAGPLKCLHEYKSGVSALAASFDGRYLLTAGDSVVHLRDADTLAEVAAFPHEGRVYQVAISQDGRRALTCYSNFRDEVVQVWDLPSQTLLASRSSFKYVAGSVTAGDDFVLVPRTSPSGAVIPIPEEENEPSEAEPGRKWHYSRAEFSLPEVENGRWRRLTAFGASFARDGRRVLLALVGQTVRQWAPDTDEEAVCFHGQGLEVMAFSAGGERALSVASDATVRVWETAGGGLTACFRGPESVGRCVGFVPETGGVFVGCDDGSIWVWDLQEMSTRLAPPLRYSGVRARGLQFGPAAAGQGAPLFLALPDGTVRAWGAARGEEVATLRPSVSGYDGPPGPATALHVSAGGRLLAAASETSVSVWDTASRTCRNVFSLASADDRFGAVALSPDGGRVAIAQGPYRAAGTDRIEVRDTHKGLLLARLQPAAAETRYRFLAFSPDGTRLVAASHGRGPGDAVEVWDCTSWERVARLDGLRGPADRLAFSGDGSRLYSSSPEDAARVWDTGDWRCAEVIDRRVDAAALAAGQPWWATPGETETAVVSARTGEEVAWLPAALASVVSHPDGRLWAGLVKGRLTRESPLCAFALETGAPAGLTLRPEGASAFRPVAPAPPFRLPRRQGPGAVLREVGLSGSPIDVFWVRGDDQGAVREWFRVGRTQAAEEVRSDGLVSVPATVEVFRQPRRGLLGRLRALVRRGEDDADLWLPDGGGVKRDGRKRTDAVLARAAEAGRPLDEAAVARRWPRHEQALRLADGVFVVLGVSLK